MVSSNEVPEPDAQIFAQTIHPAKKKKINLLYWTLIGMTVITKFGNNRDAFLSAQDLLS